MTIDDLAAIQPALIEVQARISESTARDLRGAGELASALSTHFGVEPTVIQGRAGPFGRTPYDGDLEASRAVLQQAGALVAERLAEGRRPVTLASDCSIALGTLPVVGAREPQPRILWLDAHTDFDTPATSTLSFLGCMSLAGATGQWDSGLGAIAPETVVHTGARFDPEAFDEAGHRQAETSGMTMIDVSADLAERVLAELGNAPVYVHLDPDVLDPSIYPIPYGRPGGLQADQLVGLLGALAARGPVLGIEVTAYHSADDPAERASVTQLLGEAVSAALG
ncbi:MAG TPA: arginase family protein [Solirubrobacteraceae bacterium]|nr:arginase family protein [Solirubrobacteraceae bacterium]